METVEEGVTGLCFEAGSAESLTEAFFTFIGLSYEEKKEMGIRARRKMEQEFDRTIVIQTYLQEIRRIREEKNDEPIS